MIKQEHIYKHIFRKTQEPKMEPPIAFDLYSDPSICRDFLTAEYCSRGTLCHYKHPYHIARTSHIMSYLDGIVADIALLKTELLRPDDKSTDESEKGSTGVIPGRSRSKFMSRVLVRARSKSRERLRDWERLCAPMAYANINPPQPSTQNIYHATTPQYNPIPFGSTSYQPTYRGSYRRSRARKSYNQQQAGSSYYKSTPPIISTAPDQKTNEPTPEINNQTSKVSSHGVNPAAP